MSVKFAIYKHGAGAWFLDYPDGFDEIVDGASFDTFENAVAAFIKRQDEQCPNCLRGAVEDRPWGWECAACGSFDVAVGCTR